MMKHSTHVAVVGAGACAVPVVVHYTHPQAQIDAVDIDEGVTCSPNGITMEMVQEW